MTSMAAGLTDTPETLLSADQLTGASDAELAQTLAALMGEQHRRAMEFGDLDALLEQAFADGFTSRGEAGTPWISGGLLFCPGHIKHKSATSHECCFVSIDGTWVWDRSPIKDEMRQIPGPKTHKQSITIVFAEENAKIDVVESASRSGGSCQMNKARSYQIRNGKLEATTVRARTPNGHR